METLPAELVGLLPVDQVSLASLACTSTSMRRTVSASWTFREVRVSEDRVVEVMNRVSARNLVVVGPVPDSPWGSWSPSPSPVPTPRHSPALKSLVLLTARVYSSHFWARLFVAAPALVDVTVHPVFFPDTFVQSRDACWGLMVQGADRLERLEIRGRGCENNFAGTYEPPSLATFPRLEHLAVTGIPSVRSSRRVAAFDIDAPLLESAEQGSFIALSIELSERTRRAVTRLVWSTPVLKAWLPVGFSSLVDLDVTRDIGTLGEFDGVLDSLRHVPPTVTRLRVTLNFPHIQWECPWLDYGVDVLSHLTSLEVLEVVVSFPTPRVGVLVRRLLGARPSHLRRVSLRALTASTEAHDAVLQEMRDADADPEGPDVTDLELVITSMRHGCLVPADDVRACLASFARANVEMHGLPVSSPVALPGPHPRLCEFP